MVFQLFFEHLNEILPNTSKDTHTHTHTQYFSVYAVSEITQTSNLSKLPYFFVFGSQPGVPGLKIFFCLAVHRSGQSLLMSTERHQRFLNYRL